MGKRIIVNCEVPKCEIADINDSSLADGKGNNIIIVLDNSDGEVLQTYYNAVTNILLSKNKLYIILVGNDVKIGRAICSLVANYRNYNIYKVENKAVLTEEYIDTIINRTPTVDEVQTFIGGDISGYADINMIFLGIDDLVSRGDLEGLKSFIERHIHSIEGITSVLDYMKKSTDLLNSGELLGRMEEIKTKLIEAEAVASENSKKLLEAEQEKKVYEENAERAKREMESALSKRKELEEQLESGTPVIQSYPETNTTLIKCKAQTVLYFKEVSYVPYANSLIIMLREILKLMNKRVKLVIYDSRVGLPGVYRPLSVIGGSEFVGNKNNFIANVDTFVVVEPNPTIITSILEYSNPAFDVVIVYDRMRQPTNIVVGNNVIRYYVINSNKDFNAAVNQFRTIDKSSVITRVDSTIGNEALNIPTISDFNATGTTDSARISKYQKLQSARNNKLLIKTILEKARIK